MGGNRYSCGISVGAISVALMAKNGHNMAIFSLFGHYFGCCDHIYAHFRDRLHQKTAGTCGKVVWGLFCPLWLPIGAGEVQNMVHFGPNWPNMAGLSAFQSGPKGSKRDQNGQPKCFWPFGTLLGPSGPFWAISNKNEFFAPNGCGGGASEQKINFCLKWSKRVQRGPKGSQMIKNT